MRLILALGAAMLLSRPAMAEVHEVRMLNRNDTGGMVYEPDYLQIAPGDTVTFIATHVSHNAATIPAFWPEAAATFRGRINEEIAVTFTTRGFYGIQCIPHYAMGMVMLVQVGTAPPSAAAVPESLPPRVRQRFADIITRAEAAPAP